MAIEWLWTNTTSTGSWGDWRGSPFYMTASKKINRIWMKTTTPMSGPLELWTINSFGGTFDEQVGGGTPIWVESESASYYQFTSEITLYAGYHYMVVGKPGTSVYYSSSGVASEISGVSTGTSSNYNYGNGTSPQSGVASGGNSYEVAVGMEMANKVPAAPMGVSVTNSPVPTGASPNITWTHNDPDGDPQSKYQIRWRKKD